MNTLPTSDSPDLSSAATESPSFIRSDFAVVSLLIVCIVAFFWKVLFTPAMYFYRDVFSYSYPHARFIQEICRLGQLPYWNPFLNFGEPVLANPNFLFFYPTTLLLIALPINLAYTLHFVLHFGLGAVGTYLLARRWSQSRAAAFFAAFVFAFSGPVLSLGNLYNHAAAAAWIPWVLLLTDRACESRSRRHWILLTFVFALQFLAAEPFTLIATFGMAIAYALFLCGNFRRPLDRANFRMIAIFIAVGGLMLALCAVQFLPALDLLSHSRRGTQGFPFSETTAWSLHPLSLIELVVPRFFGSSLEGPTLWTVVLGCRNMPYYPSLFVGFVPLFFALTGLALGSGRRRTFAAGMFLALLVLSFGRFTPVFWLAYKVFPPLALVRFPVKLLIPALLLVALLAGGGIDALRSVGDTTGRLHGRLLMPLKILLGWVVLVWMVSLLTPTLITSPAEWILLRTNTMYATSTSIQLTAEQVAGSVAHLLRMLRLHLPGLAGFALGGWIWVLALKGGRRWARRVLPLAAFVGGGQLVMENYSANPTVPKTFYEYQPPVIAHLQDSRSPSRFAYVFRETETTPASPDIQAFLSFESIPEAAGLSSLAQAAFRDRLMLARSSMLEKVEGVSNIDVEWSFPPFLAEFWEFAARAAPDSAGVACLMGRSSVRYQILRAREPNSARREVATIFNGSPQPGYLYESLCVTPRAFVAGSVSYSTSANETLTRMSSAQFDPTQQVILFGDSGSVPPADVSGISGDVEVVELQPNSVVLKAELSRPGYVVLLDRFDTNWHATVDGKRAPVFRANHLFRAVRAEAGQHEIRFDYRQRGLGAGLAITATTLAALAIVFGMELRRQCPRSGNPPAQ